MKGVSVKIEELSKHYKSGPHRVDVLSNVSMEVHAGERVSLVGPSGCGKSTLLHLIGMLDRPSSGKILLGDALISHQKDRALHSIRNHRVGFVFQAHNLLPEYSALGNVMIPVRLAGGRNSIAKKRAERLLEAVGLSKRKHHKPGEMSGGEQQRVALARALVMGPQLILADEPTGNLDPTTASSVFELMLELNQQLGSTLIVVTHSLQLAKRFERRLRFEDGAIVE
jgi:lipoprotein-releasing system ATP-binding protein